jgi:hypothetical protein
MRLGKRTIRSASWLATLRLSDEKSSRMLLPGSKKFYKANVIAA